MSFTTLVIQWKIIGAFTWAFFFNNVLLSRLISLFSQILGFQYIWQFEAMSLVILPFLMYTYIQTLTSVPVPMRLLHLRDGFYRVFWFVVYWFFLYLAASASIDSPSAALLAFIVSSIVAMTNRHVFYFEFVKKSRFQKFCAAYQSRFLIAMIIGGIFVPLSGFGGLCASIQLFVFSDVIFAITVVVASEPVSFTSSDNKRLIEGLKSTGITQYLAFADLYAISGGNALRRKFLFKDPSGRVFSSIVDACSKLLKSFSERQLKMVQLGNSKAPLHRLNDNQWRRNQIDRPTAIQTEIEKEEETFLQKLNNFFFSGSKSKEKLMEQMMRETAALEFSTLVMFAVQSLVRMLFVLPKEDNYGVGQICAEQILDMLLTAKIALDKTANYAFVSSGYGNNWFAKGPSDLALKTKYTVDWGVNEILRHFPTQMDYSRLSHRNIEVAERLLGRKIM
ncbi:hypothetical protein TRFO_42267 [Tritrichomonas foetus]|uniref:Uncharacterized protein n=1 Tax=Tritrichomonas foetus TaxID=1144522 RepID=A0A1J4KX42_9EUKA|nr:hypothetical protein TRFO_42267 [Tritrichomonas foetus]|eukprot:OHT15825.1 hypothetical protein TRFO_42267 [Tritrichomonas foetus]